MRRFIFTAAIFCASIFLAYSQQTDELQQAQLLRAERFFNEAKFELAREAYTSFIETYPGSFHRNSIRLRIAECHLGLGDYDDACSLYNNIDSLAISAEDLTRLNYGIAICHLKQGQIEVAKAGFARVANSVNSLRPGANFYQGLISFQEGNFNDARRFFEMTDTSSEPGRRRDVYIAQIELAEGSTERALAAANRGLGLSGLSTDEKAALERVAGEANWKSGNRTRAIEHLQRYTSLTTSPTPSACYLLGLYASEQGQNQQAVEYFNRAAEDSGLLKQAALLALGQELSTLGQYNEALSAFERAINTQPSDTEVRRQAYYNYASTHITHSNVPFGSSAEILESFLREYPSGLYTDRVRSYLAQVYMENEDYDLALERLDAIVAPSNEITRAKQHLLYLMGCRALNSGNHNEALQHLNRAADINSDRAISNEIELWQGRALMASGDFTLASSKLRNYLRNENAPNRPTAAYALGYSEYSRGHYGNADNAFIKAEQSGEFSGKELADILNRRADIAYYDRRFQDAANLYERALSASASSGDYASFRLASMKGYLRDYAGQLQALERFGNNYPTSSLMPDALLEKATAQLALGHSNEAINCYNELIENYPLTAQGRRAYILKAMTLLESGQQNEAAEAYREVIRRHPSSEEASQASDLLRTIMAEQGRGDEYLSFINSVQGAPTVERTQAARLSFDSAKRKLRENGDSAPMEAFLNEYSDAPEAEEAIALLAEADYSAGRANEALQRWQTLERRASSPAMVLRCRMGILRAARDLGDINTAGHAAELVLESSAAGGADINEASYSRALFLSEDSTTIDQAIVLWQSVADNTDDLYGAKSAFAVAEALFNQGKLSEAQVAAQALSSSRTPHRYWIARSFILQADILVAQDKAHEAREYIFALQRNYPGTEPDIHAMIEQRLQELN